MAPNTRLAAKAYATVSTETSIATVSPHALIQMLFEGALTHIDKAQQHAKARRRVEKAQALHRAIRIIEEGLNASLDMTQGTLAAHLRDVYAYSATCLLKAYSPQNEAKIAEARKLIALLRDSWNAIAPVASTPAAPDQQVTPFNAQPAASTGSRLTLASTR